MTARLVRRKDGAPIITDGPYLAIGGLTTAQIAAAFLVPEATMAQRISRAKQSLRAGGVAFAMPDEPELPERLRAVLHVLYLIFNEGYTATTGPDLTVPRLSDEAIRLTRRVRRLLPADGEVAGLLALMLLTDARRPARIRPDGSPVPLAEQDRGTWDRSLIARRGQADHRGVAPRPGRPLPVAGRHRRDPRRGRGHGRHRLASDPALCRGGRLPRSRPPYDEPPRAPAPHRARRPAREPRERHRLTAAA
jgi:hypothetical protein